MDEFTIEQNQPLDCVTAPDIIISSSSHSSSSSTHSMSASSHGALVSLSLYSSSTLDNEQLKELIIRMKRVYKDYDVIHDSHHGKNSSVPNHRLYASTNLISSSAEDVANCFREVPDLFFRSDFSQQSLETFTVTLGSREQLLSGRWPLESSSSSNSLITNNKAHKNGRDDGRGCQNGNNTKQQDNLSRYLDLVEVALLKHIWSRSPAFFRALDDIKGLQEQVQQASSSLRTLRIRLHALDEETAVAAMRIPQMFLRQKNESSLSEKIASIQRVLQARTDIQCLLEDEDYLGALDEIGYAKQLFSKELIGLNCVKMVGQQLDSYDELVCEILCNRFVSLAIGWDEDSTSQLDKNENEEDSALAGKSNNLDDDYTYTGSDSGDLRDLRGGNKSSDEARLLEDLLIALLKCDHLPSALKIYKSRLSEAIKLIVRTCVQEYLSTAFDCSLLPPLNMDDRSPGTGTGIGTSPDGYSDAVVDDNTPFAQRVKEMGDDNFLSCLAMCFEHAISALTRSGRVDRLIESALKRTSSSLEVTDADLPLPGLSSPAIPSPAIISTPDAAAVATAIVSASASTPASLLALSKSCLATACDLAQRSIAQLLALRRDATARISVEKMTFMWEISLHFVLTLEGLSGSTAYVIRQCLLTQTRAFLEHMHTTVKGRLVNTLDSERWAQCDVGADRQLELDRLSSGKLFMHKQEVHSDDNGVLKSAASMNSSNTGTGTGTGVRKKDCAPATVDGSPFKVVWSVMLLTEITLTYLDISVSFPPVTTDVIAKIVELIKLFDHRTKQLVLGAQAIQSAARLKSISVKHLAVTAQSIGLLLALMPHVRAALLAQLPPKHHMQLLELDRVSNVLIDHHGRIVAKFVGIVGDFVDNSASRLRLVDWDSIKQGQNHQNTSSSSSTSTSSTSSSCEYFDEIQRNVTALHRVLLETLPAEQVQDVFSRIFALLNRRIPMHFEEIMPTSSGGKQRILDEVAHLVVAFLRLKQIDQVAAEATNVLEEIFRKRYSNGYNSNNSNSGNNNNNSNNTNNGSNNNNNNNNSNNNNKSNSSSSSSSSGSSSGIGDVLETSPLSVAQSHDNATDRSDPLSLSNTDNTQLQLQGEVSSGVSSSQSKGVKGQQSIPTLIPSAT